MSKIAIISDVHANIEALNLVMKDIEKRNVDKIICLGDLVTKYFYPAEIVDMIKKNCDIVIKGNCDDIVANDERYKFARSKLGLDRIEYLDNLPKKQQLMINKSLINLFHATPNSLDTMFNPFFENNNQSRYKDNSISKDDYEKMFISDKPQISIVGHTHHNYIAVEDKKKLKFAKSPIVIPNTQRAIINVGSVGEHNNMIVNDNNELITNIDPFVTYAIIEYDNLGNDIKSEIIKVPYKDSLKKVYFDMVKMQNENNAPYSPRDTKKVRDSLINMGVDSQELDDNLMKRGL